ncbi:MAG: hypothetical protein ACYDEN_05825, partial [Acidimicrobiales bacterium]
MFDAGDDLYRYQCYWFGGRGEGHVLEHARVPTDVEAVAWGLARTPSVRIRLPDHRTYWAGSAPNPGGFFGTWAPTQAPLPSAPYAGARPAPAPVAPRR